MTRLGRLLHVEEWYFQLTNLFFYFLWLGSESLLAVRRHEELLFLICQLLLLDLSWVGLWLIRFR